ncbi:hypothetical protein CIRMBP1310_01230 [Enterococcus cecorum]|uniref:DUF2577 family protein n=1 Tax=Enterococcus cecorum TaxID=44008 RepID=UPI000B07A60D|nr:DUF2577 family protein [Enterococcus cecorum]CAI3285351.1 hypothetical protein CIRMBP1204_00400 [Enterococcus cecorum]CAI3366353.1 hypothetical protein CIRMBP1290_00642 [Enterococcus cecorum]CAI3429611.1 hypothetical protein CIRMBP1310_01230 [Enterococcus cecorum]CAI3494374.1 hypothetical protein CIRMBP1311_01950 [Enterococcus cecorum]CAI3519747.1 hypothetical protein CIRMBP1287_01731 [Enterococcus cecorum]
MAGEKLAKLIKQQKPSAGSLTDLMYGVVTSTSPLKIRVDSRFEVGAAHLVLSQMVRRLVVRTSDGASVEVFRDLVPGDTVRLLRVSAGQKFYVLERA